MRAPGFWTTGGWPAAALQPLAWVNAAGGALRQAWTRPARAAVPVICIGNVGAGGAGKTPTARAVAARLRGLGLEPAFLLRGHGGRARGPLLVDPARHDAAHVGDEALLLARDAPTIVARDRVAGAAAAAAAGAGVIVMDDGFQNPALAKTGAILVVDAPVGLGNGRVIPAGPLREPPARAAARADAVLLVGPGNVPSALAGLPLLRATLEPLAGALDLAGRPVLAFAGIGRPQKFFDTVAGLGARLVGQVAFPDHHPYAPMEVMRLVEAAAAQDALLLTTEKDAVRLPPEARPMVQVLPVTLRLAEPAGLDRLLGDILARHATG
ncbi:tetraacyldisaccharide 4'-kinase [Zavarzinia sp. CC-PAN008]|uniref:tetraacyldisaccharide 4'-kinase n=1 Tax=Zavarzinia sp. CC-PAN008 TaxID=3243332 RepID=UPI003F74420B